MLPEVEDADAAGVAAMSMVVRLRRGEEIARKKKAESSGDSPSQQGGGKLWSAWEQGDHSAPPPLFKYRRPHNRRIRNQRPDWIGPAILRRIMRDKR
jgi:hypothetical protein